MSRRVEITIPNDWAPPVREILESQEKCGFNSTSGKPNMITELRGLDNTIFFITIPGPAVGPTLEQLRKNGIGVSVGRVILSSLDYMKPDLSKPLAATDVTVSNMAGDPTKKPAPLKGFSHFQKARKTTEEMYNEISNNASMTINTWMNLLGASFIAAGGLVSGVLVFVVAAMLVSPIMGPILGMTMGYRVADFKLFKTGLYNEIKMAFATYFVGVLCGAVLGKVGNTYKWPNSAMMPEGQGFNMVISIIVSAAAGMVLGVSLTSAGGNALVGTAISAGLLPPLVNAGMLMTYSWLYAPRERMMEFYEMGVYSILFYASHVVTIIIVANLVFWLKDVDPRFKEGEDANFEDCPTLVEHKRRLEEEGKEFNEREKVEFFFNNMRKDFTKDIKEFGSNLKDNVGGFAHTVTGGLVGSHAHGHTAEESTEHTVNPMFSSAKQRRGFSTVEQQEDDFDEDYEDNDDDYDVESSGHVEMSTRHAPSSQYSVSSKKGPVSSRATASTEDLKAEIAEFYRVYNPEKLSSLSEILQRYAGKEQELLDKLHKQYDVERTTRSDRVTVPAASSTEAVKAQIAEFYRVYNPEKLSSLPEILQRYAGKEQELLDKLYKQYNVPLSA